jgi:hypothetical protein
VAGRKNQAKMAKSADLPLVGPKSKVHLLLARFILNLNLDHFNLNLGLNRRQEKSLSYWVQNEQSPYTKTLY